MDAARQRVLGRRPRRAVVAGSDGGRARLGNLLERPLLVAGVAADRGDQVGDEVRATLE